MRKFKLSKETKKLFKIKRSFSPFSLFLPLLLAVFIVSYTAFDNNRILVDELRFSMPTLPKELEGYALLHLTDIHEKDLGEQGEALLRVLKGKKFDVAVITGGLTGPDGQAEGFLQAVEYCALQGKPVYYILGDGDPAYMDYQQGGGYVKNQLYATAEAMGAVYLDLPIALTQGEIKLWLTPASALLLNAASALSSLDALENSYLSSEEAVRATGYSLDDLLLSIAYSRERYTAFADALALKGENDLTIMLSHMPALPTQEGGINPLYGDADLVLSGHQHGGQFRLPLVGAAHVDNPQLPRGGWLPPAALVEGLSAVAGPWQYIGRGLGTGRRPPFNFRFLATPTVSLISLTRKVDA